jgi:hypothetical protein
VEQGGPPPARGNADRAFADWCGIPKERPLVLVSKPNYQDPDGWKPFTPDSEVRTGLFEQFAAHAGPAFVCPPGAIEPIKMRYGPRDLVPSKSYRDRAGRMLVSVGLDPRRNSCDGPTDIAWMRHWFLVAHGVRYLGANLWLVDAGDYDGDGASEALFAFTAYNNDGYVLFYDGFRKNARFGWSYH